MSCFLHRMERKQQRREARIRLQVQPSFSAEPIYGCSRCGHALFEESTKFESGTGFPSFWAHKGEGVVQRQLSTYGRERIQLLCGGCGQHLGHLFPNKHTPSRLRYCINAAAIVML
ncbi:peptide-methionine (R)-S-oxide reductase [Cesiribacter andamanensis]|uniref:peptide-methionine (R)-S-oxide reductase n=1 Tax=Cesiribacter andamanensis AMV16 TaxID=1279009 RepID=M7NP25_9BACT|nr:peptide-methionine (R)-S-oxide reductase [Cesiribacter andamanensis]EMR03480.1 Peptide methionine sulfoxide reductase MsrB [Cesiribacter andamanensis AMV16]